MLVMKLRSVDFIINEYSILFYSSYVKFAEMSYQHFSSVGYVTFAK